MGTVTPGKPMGGTELAVGALQRNCPDVVKRISLGINCLPRNRTLPVVCWFQHDYNQPGVQWLRDKRVHDEVQAFVFVSHWQRERFQLAFDIPSERCHVIRNAVDWRQDVASRTGYRFAYTSTPFRGLDVLLDAWGLAEMPDGANLHIFSSMAIYGQPEGPYEALYDRARQMRGVSYHGYQPNNVVRDFLPSVDFLAYPCTFEETSCISVIEALSAGCQVICPAYGALPETAAGFARHYSAQLDPEAHVRRFADELKCATPGVHRLQVPFMRAFYSWEERAREWRELAAVLNA